MNCPHCTEEVIAARSIDRFYRFFVHRSTKSLASGRVIVSGCLVTLTKSVESWTLSQFEAARAGTSETAGAADSPTKGA